MKTSRPLIAVVDDDVSVRNALKRQLRSAGLDVQTYAGGRDLLSSMLETSPDCVVLDIRMPDMTGYDVQARLVAAMYDVPIIFVTALDDPGDEQRAMESGAFAFLRKPFGDQALLAAVENAVMLHRKPPASR